MKNVSLKYKLFFALTATVVFYAVCSVLFVNLYLKSVLKKHLIDMGGTVASTLSSQIADAVLIKDIVGIDSSFEDTIKNNPDVSYIFIEKDGEVLLHTFRGGFPRGLLNVGHKMNAADYVIVETGGESIYDFSYPVFGGRGGILRLGITGKTTQDILDRTVRYMVYVALAAVSAALVFSIIVSKRMIKPLSVLTTSAMKVAGGDYSKAVEVYGSDEVGKLSSAFNKMSDAVKVREKELREINEELETVNIKLNEYIEELNRTKDELVRAKQDAAVVETSRAMIHHMRQPITYLVMAIELFTDEIQGGAFDADLLQRRLFAIEEAGRKVSEILRKFEQLKEYRVVEYSDRTKIIDIGE